MVKATSASDMYAKLEELPENLVGEILEGELVVSPRPALRHSVASSSIHGDLHASFGRRRPGGWWILFEPELHLGDNVLVPDIAGWRIERLPTMPDEAFATLAPDWVCEVMSPRTAALDRVRKMPIYAREGVSHLWLVDPSLRTLEVNLLDGSSWLLHAVHQGDAAVKIPPFDQVALDLSFWWVSEPDPQEPAPDAPAAE